MPRTIFPPTPAPSMDIVGKVGEPDLPSKDRTSFTLPPPAIVPACNGVAHTKDEGRLQTRTISDYSLPPPPTRARKIIQMTPKMDPSTEMADSGTVTAPAKARRIASGSSSAARKATKKQPSSTNQAGKRTARKTAHSVIERRRRSKMNEEFGVLKYMIPACKNQEMHKLAILQASIEYLRYLEQCIRDLRATKGLQSGASPLAMQQSTPSEYQQYMDEDEDDDDDFEDIDVEMSRPAEHPRLQTHAQQQTHVHTSPYSGNTSPILGTFHQRQTSYILSPSGLPSPALGPVTPTDAQIPHPFTSSVSSPTLKHVSSKEADEEATAALLMLNKDRRNTNTSSSSSNGRGMSVKDLLSS